MSIKLNQIGEAFLTFFRSNFRNSISIDNEMLDEITKDILFSKRGSFYVGQVLSGHSLPAGKEPFESLFTRVQRYTLGDGKDRFGVRWRDISQYYYNDDIPGIHQGFADPMGIQDKVEKEYWISKHPLAYTEGTTTQPIYGSIIAVRQMDGAYYIDSTVNMTGFSITRGADGGIAYQGGAASSDFSSALGQSAANNPEAAKWGLRPVKRKYIGKFSGGQQPIVENGFPVWGKRLLQVPDKANWKLKGGGNGGLLKDFIDSFNRMAFAYHKDLGEKLHCSGIRSFADQIYVRKRGVFTKKNCPSMTASGCSTAKPGTSRHGWGAAIDIKRKQSGKFLTFSSPNYLWMKQNAAKYRWRHPKWAHKKSEGGSKPEPWHWEPFDEDIKKVLIKIT